MHGEAIAPAANGTRPDQLVSGGGLKPVAAARKLRVNGDGFGEGEDHKLVKPW
jgi:hypothetical protein